MKLDKRIIIILIIIIALISAIIVYGIVSQDSEKTNEHNNTTNKTRTLNATLEPNSNSASGKYGYCAVCGKALTQEEANNEYTQGKVCHACANNPYYQSGPGAEYANKKLEEAYPNEYSWENENNYNDYDYNDYDYDDSDYYDEEYY